MILFPSSLNPSDLNGRNGFVINGIDRYDSSGSSVSNAGDVNGDGFDDIIIGAPGAGESYVVFGQSGGFTASFDLSTLNGSNGFVLNGIDEFDSLGSSVSSAGDVNGDGIDDILIGAFRADPNGNDYAGESYVVFGRSNGFTASFDLSTLNGSNGFVINGIDVNDRSGSSVSNAGDVNGDGIDDILIGASGADPNGNSGAGESYVVFGKSGGFAASFDLSTLNGSNGFVINGIDAYDGLGSSVSNAGDVNGDGIDDILIGTSRAGSYVVFGQSGGFTASFDLSNLNGNNGFFITNEFNYSGVSLSSAGDVNGDGFDDILIGNPNALGSDGAPFVGESYVVFGKSGGFTASFDLSDLDGSNGFVLKGTNFAEYSGISVSSAGDVNDDGFDDILIGTLNFDRRSGPRKGYVVFGKSSEFAASFDLSTLNGSNGFVFSSLSGRIRSSVSNAGDLNGDGIDDIIIGAPGASFNGNRYAGVSYVIFGKSPSLPPDPDASPYANDDDVTTNEDRIFSGNVLVDNGKGADFDPNGDPLTVTEVNGNFADVGRQITLTSGALLTLNADGTFSYDPNDQFESLEVGETDTDDFTYTIDDGNGGTDTAIVTITITGENDVPTINLSTLNGSNGFVLNGIDASDFSGGSVSSAGDVNGDGIDDIIIGASGADPNGNDRAGESYVVFGQSGGFTAASFDLSTLDGSNGFVISGIDAGDSLGGSVSSAGDVNGDGIDDIIIGAPFAGPNGNYDAGESYVVFGQSGGFAASFDLSTLDGSNGFVLNGIDAGDVSGHSVSSAGDVNGDGIDDILIGAWFADPNGNDRAGESYVVFGQSGGFVASFDLSTLNGSNGFVLNGIDEDDVLGRSVSSAGDVNGDGFDDIIIGATGADPNGNSGAGESYVVFGKSGGFAASFDLSTLDGSNGFVLNGIDLGDLSGLSVSSAGDVNGDGIDDIIIGARDADPNGQYGAGESYVVFGKSGGWTASFDLSTLNGSNGFVISGIDGSDESGNSVSSAGDVNGDGIDDILIGAPFASPNGQYGAGESYVVFGKSSGWTANLDLLNFDGFVINGIDAGDRSGRSVSGAGDVNGDGIDDIIIGAYFASPNGNNNAGESYVIFGIDTSTPRLGTPGADVLNGTFGNDTIAGLQGNDTIFGGGGDDVLRGDNNSRSPGGRKGGNDIIYGGTGNDRIGGKGGNDQLFGEEGDDQIWGDDGDDLLRGGLGNDILTGDDFSGGQGSDTFVLAVGEGTDTIVDFELGIDLIGLADGLSFGQLSFTQQGTDAVLSVGSETLAILNDVDANALKAMPNTAFVTIV